MNVPSFAFLGFAALAALLVNLSSAPGWRRTIFLLANLAFILSFTRSVVQLAPFGALLLLGFASLKLMERYKNKAAFVVLMAALIASFCLLKRYAFVPPTFFLTFAYFAVGMSYVFFRILHLVIDAYQDALPGRVGLLSYANYTLNFTSLVSGPIQLYPEYHRMENSAPATLGEPAVGRALERIVVGFFKVSAISPLLGYLHERAVGWAAMQSALGFRVADAALILAIFPVFLYINFSGYMDFVIGVARFMRLELPENFNRPFVSAGFIEFWGRWHMTLSNWLKTYVYSPLLLNLMRRFPSPRVEPFLGVLTYFVTFFLIGLWHGPTSMFIVYGVLLGLGVSVNKLYQILMIRRMGRARYRTLCAGPLYAALSRGLTFVWFAFSMLWFWSTWPQLGKLVAELGPAAIVAGIAVVLGVSALALTGLKYVEERLPQFTAGGGSVLTSRYVRTAWCTVLAVLVISITVALNAPAPHIVYKAF